MSVGVGVAFGDHVGCDYPIGTRKAHKSVNGGKGWVSKWHTLGVVTGGASDRYLIDGKTKLTLTYKGNLTEKVGRSAFERTVDQRGTTVTVGGALSETVSGSVTRSVSGAVSDTAVGGYGLSSGGGINLSSGGPVKIAAGMPDLTLKALSLDALAGNISVNTMLGVMQVGGLSAISPAVLGDGLMIHLTMLAQILKAVNPLTVAAYGPALDAWAAMTPVVDLSYFAYLKRLPVG